ncbi:MAG: signal recognition particle-docking protein FtsY [Verrucomicrobiota bacterium]
MPRLFSSILEKFKRQEIDWDELEETLIAGDLGVSLTVEIIEKLRARGRKLSAEDVVSVCREEIEAILGDTPSPIAPLEARPKVILVVGVNGVGKTTSIAKLANHLKSQGHSILLAAGDTFRAAAIEQLEIWAKRIDVSVVKGTYQADPSAVCFDAYQAAVARNVDFLICDTAGRLHTRHNLMEELKKTCRTLGKIDDTSPHETLLVVDATTGSNARAQAKEFHQALSLTGLIITKLDGSGKGGVVAGICRELDIPPRFIGTGESLEDFHPFDSSDFVSNIL